MSDCLFCKIIAGEIPSTQRHSSDLVIAFNDIAPQAPLHVLCATRQHTVHCSRACTMWRKRLRLRLATATAVGVW